MTPYRIQILLISSLLLLMTNLASSQAADRLVVFSAASAGAAIEEIASAFSASTGIRVQVSPAATSVHARQIAAGAQADLFISAHPNWMKWADDKNLIERTSRTSLMSNQLVLAVSKQSDLPASLTTALSRAAQEGRIAMGDPDHVPVGQYGKAALIYLGLWDGIQTRLARSPNAVAAISLIARGEVSAGIVYATDVRLSPAVRLSALFPAASYPAIRYEVAIVKGRDRPLSRKFLDRLLSRSGRQILASHGFSPCTDIQPC